MEKRLTAIATALSIGSGVLIICGFIAFTAHFRLLGISGLNGTLTSYSEFGARFIMMAFQALIYFPGLDNFIFLKDIWLNAFYLILAMFIFFLFSFACKKAVERRSSSYFQNPLPLNRKKFQISYNNHFRSRQPKKIDRIFKILHKKINLLLIAILCFLSFWTSYKFICLEKELLKPVSVLTHNREFTKAWNASEENTSKAALIKKNADFGEWEEFFLILSKYYPYFQAPHKPKSTLLSRQQQQNKMFDEIKDLFKVQNENGRESFRNDYFCIIVQTSFFLFLSFYLLFITLNQYRKSFLWIIPLIFFSLSQIFYLSSSYGILGRSYKYPVVDVSCTHNDKKKNLYPLSFYYIKHHKKFFYMTAWIFLQ